MLKMKQIKDDDDQLYPLKEEEATKCRRAAEKRRHLLEVVVPEAVEQVPLFRAIR